MADKQHASKRDRDLGGEVNLAAAFDDFGKLLHARLESRDFFAELAPVHASAPAVGLR